MMKRYRPARQLARSDSAREASAPSTEQAGAQRWDSPPGLMFPPASKNPTAAQTAVLQLSTRPQGAGVR